METIHNETGLPKEIRVYRTRDGSYPYDKWYKALHTTVKQRVRMRLLRLRLGNPGDVKPVGSGVHELRIRYGPGYRVYFGNDGEDIIVLLAGGDKLTQEKDIERAKEYWKDYQQRGAYEKRTV